ncbi:MAG: ABC transporter substrate-binding protein [Deltaproteobacteria bacterium]|nr:ABC transporter substrate-binding protein [Deltaproteobacteria bacterium]
MRRTNTSIAALLTCLLSAAGLAAVVLDQSPTAAQPRAAQSGPRALMRARYAQLSKALNGAPADAGAAVPEPQRRQVRRILSSLIDYDEIARRSLATHWEQRTPAERTEFTQLLRALVEQAYERNLRTTMRWEVQWAEESVQGDATIVGSVARSREERRRPPIRIDYHFHRIGTSWKVFDIVTDQVSLVDNYRGQFGRIITRNGYADLIRRMRARQADPESPL